MMLLAIDTTAAIATAALFRDGILIAEREADAGRKHAETLLPVVDLLLEENGVKISEIDLYAVDIGPGSFTGVRIGVSLVNALAFASGKMVVSIDSLKALALSAGDTNQPVAAMIDARNGNAYAALYRAGQTLIEPCAIEINAFIKELPPDTIFVGDTQAIKKTYPRARFVGQAALLCLESAHEDADPLYLRPSQAERTKKESSKEA